MGCCQSHSNPDADANRSQFVNHSDTNVYSQDVALFISQSDVSENHEDTNLPDVGDTENNTTMERRFYGRGPRIVVPQHPDIEEMAMKRITWAKSLGGDNSYTTGTANKPVDQSIEEELSIDHVERPSVFEGRIAAVLSEGKSAVSMRLYRVLEKVGASEKLRLLHQQMATTEEILGTIQSTAEYETTINVFKCGSYYEGSFTPGLSSDVDTIFCLNIPELVLSVDATSKRPFWQQLLVFRSDYTYPGYVKLQQIHNGEANSIYNANTCKLRAEDVDYSGNECQDNYSSGAENENGPADAYFSNSGKHLVDSVMAKECKTIPPFARHWLSRERKYNWPSKEQLDKMSEMGCMVVSSGYADSCEQRLEWRLSFSLQERFLMTSLNPVQHKVYILLKLIKKDLLPDGYLTSYQCKTCIFQAVENTPSRIWRENNIMNCLLLCLRMLLKYVKQRCLPHFFAEDHNLFRRHSLRHILAPLGKKLKALLDEDTRFFFRIKTDNIGALFLGEDSKGYEEKTTAIVASEVYGMKMQVIANIWPTVRGLLVPSKRVYLKGLLQILEDYQNGKLAKRHSKENTTEAMSHVLPRIYLHLALGAASNLRLGRDSQVLQSSIQTIDSLFERSFNTDTLATGLAKATVFLAYGFHRQCYDLLAEMRSNLDPDILSVCSCKRDLITNHIPNPKTMDKSIDMSICETLCSYIANCVVFLPTEINLVPTPLRYEALAREHDLYTEDWIKVDAKVYLHFLMYLVSSKLEKDVEMEEATGSIMSLVITDPNLGHRRTALNLLGWIYAQNGDMSMALSCFKQSLILDSSNNAASLHIRDLFQIEGDMMIVDEGMVLYLHGKPSFCIDNVAMFF